MMLTSFVKILNIDGEIACQKNLTYSSDIIILYTVPARLVEINCIAQNHLWSNIYIYIYIYIWSHECISTTTTTAIYVLIFDPVCCYRSFSLLQKLSFISKIELKTD